MFSRFHKYRAIGLGFIGVGSTVRGATYIMSDLGAAGAPAKNGVVKVLTLGDLIPISVAGLAWIIVGLLAITAIFLPRLARRASNLTGSMLFLWGLAYALAFWPLGVDPKGWISGATYISVGGLVLSWMHLQDPIETPSARADGVEEVG